MTSNSGLGKTHLLHAIANEIKKEKRSFVYFNPAIFLRDIVNLLKENNNDIITKLLEYYSNVDLVLFDDFETIAEGNKIATKNFIFQIIDTRLQNKKPTIIASQKEINSLKEVLDEKLITRLSSGFITKINEPKKEDLMKILEFLLTENGINISNINEKSKNYIIRNHSKNISSLIGAVKRIDFYKEEINNSNNTEEIIYSIFKDLVKEIDEILPENILKTIAKHYRINTKDILGKTREAKVVVARHIAMNIFKELLDWSSVEIGKYFYRDHSTVLNAFKKHKQNQINNKDNEFEIIKNKILGIN
ncbi:helix-turn-helix domain-containing protein [Mycoplasmopsis gallopavonis]|uniref:helix-turn-helix domain-containing protein n=1 Tax=Mycoplasmopsis gallopavonis TaxID=76629 RepID=UPI001CB7A782|nr:DnaA/Hda family protein [Mycoplasmopsis gallopavonis]